VPLPVEVVFPEWALGVVGKVVLFAVDAFEVMRV